MKVSRKALYLFLLISFINLEYSSAFPAFGGEHKATIAVLNFQSNTGDNETDTMLSIGTPETIITDLSNIKELQVVERNKIIEVMKEISLGLSGFIDEFTAQRVGLKLGAQYILIGNWQKYGNQYRVNARLVEVESARIIVGIKETGIEASLFDMQDNISEQILSNLGIGISYNQKYLLRKRETVSLDAYKQYAQGLAANDEGNNELTQYYMRKALELDPEYEKPQRYIYVFKSGGGDPIEVEAGSQISARWKYFRNFVLTGAGMGLAGVLLAKAQGNHKLGFVEGTLGGAIFGAIVGLGGFTLRPKKKDSDTHKENKQDKD